MKRDLMAAALDDAAKEEMKNLFRVLRISTLSRDETALDKFENGLMSIAKAYDAASRSIIEKFPA